MTPASSTRTPATSRREFLRTIAASAIALPPLAGCASAMISSIESGNGGSARLLSRPRTPGIASSAGIFEITPGAVNDGYLVIPPGYDGRPLPFVLGLHGATGSAAGQVNLLRSAAESRGLIILAVGSRGLTWDAMTYRFSYDVTFIDRALGWAFDRVAVDPARLSVEGFSDGATYAIGLALANGDLFTRAVAFSPGFIPHSDSPPTGKPSFFESHGREDSVLPIDGASRRIVPELERRGYPVRYMEFDGGHAVPAEALTAAADFMVA